MARKKLTDLMVRKLKPEKRRYSIFDTLTPGLELRVGSTGIKSWTAVARVGAQTYRKAVGHYPAVSLRDARDLALQQQREWTAAPRDPELPEPQLPTSGPQLPTVAEAVKIYCDDRGDRRAEEIRSILTLDLLPLVGDQQLDQPTRRDLLVMLDRVLARVRARPQKSYTGEHAVRMAKVCCSVFWRWAQHRYDLDTNPVQQLDLRAVLPRRAGSRSRVLTPEELAVLWRGTSDMSARCRIAVRLLLLTATRRGEITAAEKSEFVGNTWTIPGAHTKKNREHVVPLSRQAEALIAEAAELWPRSRYLIPSPTKHKGDRPMSQAAYTFVIYDRRTAWGMPDITLHDLRRSAASHMSRRGVRYDVLREILGHRIESATAAYVWMAPLDDMRDALQRWADYLDTLTVQITDEETP